MRNVSIDGFTYDFTYFMDITVDNILHREKAANRTSGIIIRKFDVISPTY